MFDYSTIFAVRQTIGKFWLDLPLRLKGLIVIATPLAALWVVTLSFYLFQRMDRQLDASVSSAADACDILTRCRAHLLERDCAVYLYLRTGDQRHLSDLAAATSAAHVDLRRLENLLQNEPAQLGGLRRLQRSLQEEDATPQEILDAPSHLALDTELQALRDRQQRLLAWRAARVERLRTQKLWVLVADSLLGLGGGLLAILLFTSGVVRRVERLQAGAALLEHRLPPLPLSGGRDELGCLERALERSSASLRESEEQRQRLFTLSLDMLSIATLDGQFTAVNPAFTRILGHSEAALVGCHILDFVHAEDHDSTARQIAQLAQGQPITYLENRFRCADGSFKWLAWSVAPFVEEGLAYAVARDRTRQKQDEEALLHSNTRLQSLLECTTDAFFAVDSQWRVICVNRQAERLWMRTRDELLNHDLRQVFPEAHGGPFYRMYEETMRDGRPGHLEDFYPPLQRWFEAHAYPSAEGLSVYFRDVTQRRQADTKIKHALQEKEILLREVHHRVKNNLQVICSMLRLQAGYVHDGRLLQVLKDCRERVLAMAMLHDQLHRAKDLSNINLGQYIRDLGSSLFYSYGVNSAEIQLHMEVDDITVAIDSAIPCGLIVHELLSNSLRHAFPEGARGQVSLGVHGKPGGRVELTVCDDGRGFSERSFTGNRPLGLRLVDLLAEQLDAAVERSSQAGVKFKFLFARGVAKGE